MLFKSHEHWEEFGFDLGLAKAVADLCRVHRKSQNLLSNIDEIYCYKQLKIRTRFLGALLSLSDGFDILTQRSILSKIAGDLPSKRWQFNELVISVEVDPRKWLLSLRTVARSPEEIQVVLGLRDFLQKSLATISPILHANGIFYSLVNLDNQFEMLS